MKGITFRPVFSHHGEDLVIKLSTYGNGNLAILTTDLHGEPCWTLSVNMPPYDRLPDGVFFLKDWSENEEVAASFLAQLHEYIEPAIDIPSRESGWIVARAYRWLPEAQILG